MAIPLALILDFNNFKLLKTRFSLVHALINPLQVNSFNRVIHFCNVPYINGWLACSIVFKARALSSYKVFYFISFMLSDIKFIA